MLNPIDHSRRPDRRLPTRPPDPRRTGTRRSLPRVCPRNLSIRGRNAIHQTVNLAVRRAQSYSFHDQPRVRFSIDMMLILGSDFDTDPQFPWAAETLKDTFFPPTIRGLALHRDLTLYMERVMGPRRQYAREALCRFALLPDELPPPVCDQRNHASRNSTW